MTTYEYWRNRERERRRREEQILDEAEKFAEIEAIYEGMYDWADREINAFYGKYADAEGIDIAEAKKRVSNLDIEAYEKMAEQYVKGRNFSPEANQAMRLYNATMKINRLELLKAKIGLHMVDGFDQIDKLMGEYLTDEAVAEYERQAGILGTTITDADTLERAHNIVDASFYNATYSERIWSHQDNLRDAIGIELQKGLIAGNSSRVMARRIKDQFGVSQDDAFRLMVTEFRRVQTDVAMDSYKSQDIDQYMYMAVNPQACPICRELNGKIYDVEGAEIGNPDHPLPPMHPRCHCTTAPYINEEAYEDWLTWLENGGTTAMWEMLTPEERAEEIRLLKAQQPQEEPKAEPKPQEEPKETVTEADAELNDALADAYEYHRKTNDLNVVPYDDIPKGFNIINADLGNMETRGIFERTLAKLVERYDTPLQKVRLMDRNEVMQYQTVFGQTTHNYEVDSAEVRFNPLKCGKRETLVNRIRELSRSGYIVRVRAGDEDKFVATHEFAHTLISTQPLNKKRNFVNADYGKIERTQRELTGIYDEYIAELQEYESKYKQAEYNFIMTGDPGEADVARYYKKQFEDTRISKYSMENPDEFIAEAFTHSELSDYDNKYANRVRKVLDDNFER